MRETSHLVRRVLPLCFEELNDEKSLVLVVLSAQPVSLGLRWIEPYEGCIVLFCEPELVEGEKFDTIIGMANASSPWKWFVYIIECEDGLYYTGLTWDIPNRMQQHMSGEGSKFTSNHGFKELKYVEEHLDLLQARRREHQLKDFSRKKKEALWKKE